MNFHIALQIIITSIVATSIMTLFSYVISASARKLYKEPVLLTYILTSLKIEISLQTKIILGWVVHYLIGLFFVLIYHWLWLYNIVAMSWSAAFILGILSGIIGILSWALLFAIVPKKVNIDFKGYYVQLFTVHIIFTVVAFIIYQLFI